MTGGFEGVVRPFQITAIQRGPLAANATIGTQAASAQWGSAGKEPEVWDTTKVPMGSGGTTWPDDAFPPDAPPDDEEARRKETETATGYFTYGGDRGPWLDYSKSYVCFDDGAMIPPCLAWEKKMEVKQTTAGIKVGVLSETFTPINHDTWLLQPPKAKKVGNIWVREFSKAKMSGPIYDSEDEFARVRAGGAKNPLSRFPYEFYVFSA